MPHRLKAELMGPRFEMGNWRSTSASIREGLKTFERKLPLSVQRPIVRAIRDDPFTPENDATKSIFIHIPKTAGTSIAQAAYGRWIGHIPLSRFAAFNADKYREYFKYSFVRNPWDRLLSAYAHLKGFGEPLAPREAAWSDVFLGDKTSFEEFVLALRDRQFRRQIIADLHFRPQVAWITVPGSDEIGLDYLGKFETLAEDFEKVADRLGVEATLPVMKSSIRAAYQDAYSAEMRATVEELYQHDIRVLGYEF
jgi:hypothetical protein